MNRPGPVLFLLAVIFGGLLFAILYAETIAFALQRPFAARPGPDGEIEIVMEDFNFKPSVIRLKAGQRVRLRLRNEGRHTHEFMAGKEVKLEGDVSEPPEPDFFEGIMDVRVEVIRGSAMPMGFGEEEGMEGMGMGEMGGMGMAEVPTGPGIHAEGMEAMEVHGSMVMMDPMSELVIEFTVPPDKVGTWIFGCFAEDGLHYDDGMRGILIVEP